MSLQTGTQNGHANQPIRSMIAPSGLGVMFDWLIYCLHVCSDFLFAKTLKSSVVSSGEFDNRCLIFLLLWAPDSTSIKSSYKCQIRVVILCSWAPAIHNI